MLADARVRDPEAEDTSVRLGGTPDWVIRRCFSPRRRPNKPHLRENPFDGQRVGPETGDRYLGERAFEEHGPHLPNADHRGFRAETGRPPPASERGDHDLAIEWTPLDAPTPAGAIGSRIDMTDRHIGQQLPEIATGRVREHLFRHGWLVVAPGVAHAPPNSQ